MPTKIAFQFYDEMENPTKQFNPSSGKADRLVREAWYRAGEAAAYIQWWDRLTDHRSRLFLYVDGPDECIKDVQKYRDRVNPLKGKPRPYRQGIGKGSVERRAVSPAEAMRIYIEKRDAGLLHDPEDPDIEGFTTE